QPTPYHCVSQRDELFTAMTKHFYHYHAMNR
ncbi:hypothetical protein P8847_17985, partial [Bacillus inaquosorum]|nr:hypothetical protein [Bacillus inaquosorum]